MITNPEYKILAAQIANIFCDSQINKSLCITTVKTRIINVFTNETFNFFIQNIQVGRYYLLEYSNWHSDTNNCRSMKIDVKLTDVITGKITKGYWHYTATDCGNNQYKFQDLNKLISTNGYLLQDIPITSNKTEDIKKARLIYNPKAASYNIVLIPGVPGSEPPSIQIQPDPTPLPDQQNINTPVKPGIDLAGLISPTTALIAAGILAVYLFTKK